MKFRGGELNASRENADTSQEAQTQLKRSLFFSLSGIPVCSLLLEASLRIISPTLLPEKITSFSSANPESVETQYRRQGFPSTAPRFPFVCIISASPRLPLSVSLLLIHSAAPSLRHLFDLGTAAASLHLGNGTWVGAQDGDVRGAPLTETLLQHALCWGGLGQQTWRRGRELGGVRGVWGSSANITITLRILNEGLPDDDDQFAAVAPRHKMRWMPLSLQLASLSQWQATLLLQELHS